jgi:hypothetical protein
MSTKTTFKRVALVAVAALGFGVLTSVAPATAGANAAITSLSAGTPSPSRVGVTSTVTITAAHAADTTNNTFVAAAKVTSAPAGSKTSSDTNTATMGVTILTGAGTGESLSVANAYAVGGANATVESASDTAVASTFRVKFVADVAGTYTVLVSVGNSSYTAGDKSVAVTFTTAGTPTTITLASVAGQVVDTGSKGQLMSMSLKDAAGLATVLGQNEAITLSESDATVEVKGLADSADGTDSSSYSFGADDANLVAGVYYFRAVDAGTIAAGSTVITATGGGLLPSTLQVSASATKIVATTATADVLTCTTTANCTSVTTGNSFAATVKAATGITISSLTAAGATGANYLAAVVNNAAATTYDTYYSSAAAATTATFTAPAPSTGKTVVVDFGQATATFTFGAASATSLVVQGSDSVLSATGGSNKFVVLVRDQYTAALANIAVSVAVSGRNTVATRAIGVSDANGLVTYTLADAGTTGTVDTLTFTGSGSTTATVTYGTVTVGSVTVTGGATADTIAGTTKTAISAADNGPESSYVEIKAVVKDANGNLLAGVPVTFTTDAGAIVKTAAIDYATVYTGTDGAATTRAFNWLVGKQTVTATAGGVAKAGYINWVATSATSPRVLSATATGDIVSLKVVDRFGNPVQAVTINLSRTGAGLFGNGASTQNIDTDKNGTADVRFTGSGTVVAELASTYVQAYDLAGFIAETAVTAAVAGTTKGTGASLAPAGVAKVSVEIQAGADSATTSASAAADAAAEATDAANAATDAANAAAEAADAATAAAQDAADAVAALSTQVSEMVNALKKQITALTNLVIKIQKKVKA